ncbi:YdcH family protein [Pseudomonas luteola]
MVAEHNLHKDFPDKVQKFEELRQNNPEFAKLIEQYDALDQEILEIEGLVENSGDEELNRCRRERVVIKDKIARELQGS